MTVGRIYFWRNLVQDISLLVQESLLEINVPHVVFIKGSVVEILMLIVQAWQTKSVVDLHKTEDCGKLIKKN